jgi:hypothetical protein
LTWRTSPRTLILYVYGVYTLTRSPILSTTLPKADHERFERLRAELQERSLRRLSRADTLRIAVHLASALVEHCKESGMELSEFYYIDPWEPT